MDICDCSCVTCLITACRCVTVVAATLFLTRCSPSPVAHRTVLIRRLWLPVLAWELALTAQRQPLLWHHSPVASVLPCWRLDCALDTLGLGVSHHLLVDEQSSV